jgi:hypothetical protein
MLYLRQCYSCKITGIRLRARRSRVKSPPIGSACVGATSKGCRSLRSAQSLNSAVVEMSNVYNLEPPTRGKVSISLHVKLHVHQPHATVA